MSGRRHRCVYRRGRVLALIGSLLALGVVAAAASGCSRSARDARSDVVLIVIDTLRADRLPLYGYGRPTSPELEALARDAVTYERAISPGTWTVPAHGSLFTGLWPSYHGAERVPGDRRLALPLRPEAPTLAERLRGLGLRTAAFVGNRTYVAPIFGFARGFDEFADDGLGYPPALAKAVTGWIARQRMPFFLFVNVLDPHEPYAPPPPFDTMFPGKRPELGDMLTTRVYAGEAVTDAMRAHFGSQYDGEVAFADAAVGTILAALRRAGRYERALIVVTSDHGELLGEHGLAGHGTEPYEPEVHVPLLVKYPDNRDGGTRVSRRVSTLGVFATIVQQAGGALDGVQARPLGELQEVWVEDIDFHGRRVRVGYDHALKLVRRGDAAGGDRVYDLAADPAETAPADAAAARRLGAAMDVFVAQDRPANTAPRPVIDAEREAQLRALGYVE